MKKIKLDVVGLSYSQTQSGAYALVMTELNGRRRLPIIIGGFEAQAIAVELEKIVPTRPLTHDLFKLFAGTFNISIVEVIIYNLVDGVFHAKIVCNDGEKTSEIDARTSDAIALALKFECPIYTYEFILASAGIMIEGNDFVFLDNMEPGVKVEENREEPQTYKSMSDEELKEKLQQALNDEAYEQAVKIRDELSKRKS